MLAGTRSARSKTGLAKMIGTAGGISPNDSAMRCSLWVMISSSRTPRFLTRGLEEGCANAILVKVNQIGTLSETFEAVNLAQRNSYSVVMSHRSGETEDATIADIAGRNQLRSNQDRRAVPKRSQRQVQPADQDRGRTGRERRIRRGVSGRLFTPHRRCPFPSRISVPPPAPW